MRGRLLVKPKGAPLADKLPAIPRDEKLQAALDEVTANARAGK